MDLSGLLRSVVLKSFLDQHHCHGLDHFGTATQKHMSVFRGGATTPDLLDRSAPPQILDVTSSSFQGIGPSCGRLMIGKYIKFVRRRCIAIKTDR